MLGGWLRRNRNARDALTRTVTLADGEIVDELGRARKQPPAPPIERETARA
jgi:hypothetical protein